MTFFLHCFNLDDPDSPCCLLQTHYYTGNNVILVQRMAEIWRTYAGADPGFQVRGGALKKIAPSGGRREKFWGILCEKSRFYAKKSYFSNFRGGARNVWGISCEKSRYYAKKNHIFSNFRGGARRVRPPSPLNPPLLKENTTLYLCLMEKILSFNNHNYIVWEL